MKEVYDVLLVHIPTTHTVAPTVTLAQNLLLLLSGRIPARWLCQKRILIEQIQNLHVTTNKRIQLYGPPESMEKSLLIFMSLPGQQQVFKLKDYDIHKTVLPVDQSLSSNHYIIMEEVYDVLLVCIPTIHTIPSIETLAQNLLLLLSGRIPTRWLCQKRILIENIRNLHETSNKRIQMNGSPDSLENSLMIFMSLPGNQQVFQLKDYSLHTAFLPVNQSLGETLVQNCILLLFKLTPDDWLCQERSLIENIQNLNGDSNKRIQMNGSPDSLENSLMIFMSFPGNQEVFKLKDYDIHKTVLPVSQSLGGNNRIYRKDAYDVLLEYIPTMQTIAPTEKLDQNYTLFFSKPIPGDWRCEERSLIKIIRNLYGDSNNRIQMYGSPESLERCLMIFMSFAGNQLVFQPAFYKTFLSVYQSLECNSRIYRKDVYDVLLEDIPTMQTVAPTEKLDQNYMLLFSKLIPADWLCQERSLIENIRNLYGYSNKRIQMYGSPESLERSLMIFMSFPGNQLVFKLKDYGFYIIELGVDLTVENGKITAWKRNHATFEHVELEDDERANRMAWARIARRPILPWQIIDPRYAHVPDPDQTLTIKEETNRFHEEMNRIYNTGPSTSSMFVKWQQLNNNTRLQRMLIHFFR